MKELKTEQLDLVGGGIDPLSGPPNHQPFPGVDPWEWEQLLERLRQQNQQH